MADNPFYPGYKPEPWEQKPSEFYPGYFPGAPQPRKGYIPPNIGPLPYNFDSVLKEIDMIQGNVDLMTSDLPKWVYERAVDDFKRSLQVTMKTADIKPEELDDFDAESIPGAFNIGVSLNPMDWWKDPAGQAQKTVKNWAKEAFSWKDIDTRFRRDLWSQILDEKPNYTFIGSKEAADALMERVGRRPAGAGTPSISAPGENPLALRGLGVMAYDPDTSGRSQRQYFDFAIERDTAGHVKRENRIFVDPSGAAVVRRVPKKSATDVDVYRQSGRYDAYGKLASSVIEFETKSGYAASRQNAYTDVLRDTVHAIDADLGQAKYRNVINADVDRKRAYDIFRSQADTLADMEVLQKRFGKAVSDIKEGTLLNSDRTDWDRWDSINEQLDKSLANIETSYGVGGKIDLVDRKEAEKMRHFIDPYKQHLEQMRDQELLQIARERKRLLTEKERSLPAQLRAGTITQDQFDTQIKSVNDRLNDIHRTASQGKRTHARNLTSLGRGPFNGRGYLYNNSYIEVYERRLLEEVVTVDFLRPRARGKNKRIGDVIAEVPGTHASRAIGVLNRIEYENQVMAIDEVFDALTEGKFLERYVWNKVKTYIEPLTPAYWTNKALDGVHYFGLKLGKDVDFEKTWLGNIAGTGRAAGSYAALSKNQLQLSRDIIATQSELKKAGLSAANRAKLNSDLATLQTNLTSVRGRIDALSEKGPGKFWGNWFNMEFDGGHPNRRGQVDAFVSNVRISGRFYGGAHFASIGGLAQLRGMVHSGEWTPEALAYFIKNVDHTGLANPAFLQRLMALNGNRAIVLPPGINAEEFANQVINLRQWVLKNRKNFSSNVNMDSDAFWLGFVDMVAHKMKDPDFKLIGITKRYAGLFEKLWNKLNEFQTMLFTKFGKVLAPLSYIKTFIAEKIADMIPKLLSLIAGGASGGTLAIVTETLGRVLRPIIRFVVRKTLDFAQNFVGGLIRGDFFKAFAELEKQVQAFMRAMLMVSAVPMLIILVLTTAFFGSSSTTISPVDPTRSPGTIDAFETWTAGGGGSMIEILNPTSRPSTTSCFEFVDAPGSTIGQHPIGTWPTYEVDALNAAIVELQAVSGGYLDRLCAAGTIELYWAPWDPGWCGHVFGSIIVFTDTCSYSRAYYNAYLFAHETGHVYNNRVGWDSVPGLIQFAEVDDRDGGTLPTYPGDCSTSNTSGEDFAETIGNWVRINTFDCAGIDATLWGQFPAHFEFADEVLTRP
ncbi:hypothetical protein C4561_03655 [candidate division WWE3 bacterium]|jgi:hypothetical protein|uniref:Uncharacterized protein n=1 Tax=candidate division WWE3 bacterium TaxID=2053526 RepID=A0A3A4ZC55_UNCKA|nr:MAG: hypothetical protein C4561_03655 [candidate division WWE3 bacterium]